LHIQWIVDADVSGFFDTIDRSCLREMLKQRLNDGGILRLIGKWLNAGVLEAGELTYPEQGTPQGGVASPLLANVFLHYVLDEWFVTVVQPRMQGQCFLSRFAGFDHRAGHLRPLSLTRQRACWHVMTLQ
jgi:hypothetical protein